MNFFFKYNTKTKLYAKEIKHFFAQTRKWKFLRNKKIEAFVKIQK